MGRPARATPSTILAEWTLLCPERSWFCKVRVPSLFLSRSVPVSNILWHMYAHEGSCKRVSRLLDSLNERSRVPWSPKATDKPRGASGHPGRPWMLPSCKQDGIVTVHMHTLVYSCVLACRHPPACVQLHAGRSVDVNVRTLLSYNVQPIQYRSGEQPQNLSFKVVSLAFTCPWLPFKG